MKQGGIAAWNIAPLFKGNAAPCMCPACALPVALVTLHPAQGPQHPASTLLGAPAACSLPELAVPCPHPACSRAPCPCPLAALHPGQGWQLLAPLPWRAPRTPCLRAAGCCWLPSGLLVSWRVLNPHLSTVLLLSPCCAPLAPLWPVPYCQVSPPRPIWGCQLPPVLSSSAPSCPVPRRCTLSCPVPYIPTSPPLPYLRLPTSSPAPHVLPHPCQDSASHTRLLAVASCQAVGCPWMPVGSDLPVLQVWAWPPW